MWHLQRLDAHKETGRALPSTKFTFVLRRSLATAATSKARSTKPKSRKASAKKPAKKPAKRTAKKAAAKAKPKRKPKKEVTAEQQQKLRIKELKAVALTTPKNKPSTVWALVMSEYVTQNLKSGKTAATLVKEAVPVYRSLSPGELEVRQFCSPSATAR